MRSKASIVPESTESMACISPMGDPKRQAVVGDTSWKLGDTARRWLLECRSEQMISDLLPDTQVYPPCTQQRRGITNMYPVKTIESTLAL